MEILSMGDRIRPGRYAVRARFDRSLLLVDRADRPMFVVDRSIGPGPLNLVARNPHAVVPGEQLDVPARQRLGPRFDSALPRLDRAGRAKLLRLLQSALPRHAPPDSLVSLLTPATPLPRLQSARDTFFRHALALVDAGRLADGVRLIRGCGGGLTPSGDDFLCGWMLAGRLRRRFAQTRILLDNARGKNPVSNAFLELSAQGRVNVTVKRLLQAPSPARIRAVCAFGHTSGADLLCGLWWGLASSPCLLSPVSCPLTLPPSP